jgi:hypothetical protein
MQKLNTVLVVFVLIGTARTGLAAVQQFTNKAQWISAAGSFTTLTFTGFPLNTNITTQYSSLGATFTDGVDLVQFAPDLYLNDGWGLNGAFDSTTIVFSTPMRTIAAEFPGIVQFRLYNQNQLIFISMGFGTSGVGHFGGLVSDQPFDKIIVSDPTGGLFVDDLHFGPGIPAPSALALFGLAALRGRSRRRRA